MKPYVVSGALILFRFALLILLPGARPVAAQTPGRGALRLMWFNAENLFHPQDDSLPGDDEFTPEGVRHWTYTRYHNKLTALARVIVAAGEWEPPDLVGLCEVENATVLKDLVEHPVLEPYGYSFVHRNSPDHRGMDVACLYRKKRIGVVNWSALYPDPVVIPGGTRDLLHLCCSWGKGDTLDLFLVHLISKYGGAGATAGFRRKQVEWLVQQVDSVQRSRKSTLEVLAGDFNEPCEGYAMEPLRLAWIGGTPIQSISLAGETGSYKYQGKWSRIDQFLVGGAVGQYQLDGSILNLAPLMKVDEQYGGLKPARTYEGFSYAGGLSDHLPILLDISRLFLFHSER